MRDFQNCVGSEDRLSRLLKLFWRETFDQFRKFIGDETGVQLDADDTRGCREDLLSGHPQLFGDRVTTRDGDTIPRSCGAICVAGVDEDGSHQATRFLQME